MKEIILEGLDEKIIEYTAKCGLKVYMWVNEKVSSTLMTLSVKYGSIHTRFKIGKKVYSTPRGVAHFLEHVKFNMSDGITAYDEFIKTGGDANAFTTFKYTSYIVFATNQITDNLNILLNFVYNPYFTKKMITKEKGIIIEEANMTNDDAYTKMFYDSLKNTLQNLEYRYLITGEASDIKEITVDDIKLVYNTFYHPKNMFLTITGNFNTYDMIKTIEDNLSKKEFGKYQNVEVLMENEPKKVTKEYSEEALNIAYPRVKYTLKLPLNKFKNVELLDLKIMLNLIMNINFGATSLFRSDLLFKGLITSMSYSVDLYDEYITITLSFNTNYPEEIIKLAKEKMNKLEISDVDVTRKKNATIATLILDYEDIEQVSYKIQDDIINEGKIITDLKARISNINKEELEKVMKYITNDNASISVFKPKENQE